MKKSAPLLFMLVMLASTSMAAANDPAHKPHKVTENAVTQPNQLLLEAPSDNHSPDHEENDDTFNDPFFQLLNVTSFNEVPLKVKEVVELSDVIAIGKIASVTQGRTLDFIEGASHPLQMALIELNILHGVKGKLEKTVYFEYLVGGISIDSLHKLAYADEIFVFLREDDGWNPDVYKAEYPVNHLAEGNITYSLTTQRGLIIMRDGQTFQPLEPHLPMFSAQSFDDIIQQIN